MPRPAGVSEAANALLWTLPCRDLERGEFLMAEDESILVNPPTQDVAVHVDDYTRFTKLLKWGAAACFIIALLALVVIKSYW